MGKFITLILALFVGLSLLSCQHDNEHEFTFAVSGEYRPFSYVDPAGNIEGLDVEIGKHIAKKLNKEPKVVRYKFAGLIEGVKVGRFDAAVASHTITEERKKHVAFSLPYYYSGPQVFSREHRPQSTLTHKEIAVSKGSTYQKMAQKYSSNVKVYDSDITALEALARGRHDLVITDRITGAMAIKNGLKIFPHQLLGRSEQGIVVKKENTELLKKINQALVELKREGILKELSYKYFQSDITGR